MHKDCSYGVFIIALTLLSIMIVVIIPKKRYHFRMVIFVSEYILEYRSIYNLYCKTKTAIFRSSKTRLLRSETLDLPSVKSINFTSNSRFLHLELFVLMYNTSLVSAAWDGAASINLAVQKIKSDFLFGCFSYFGKNISVVPK